MKSSLSVLAACAVMLSAAYAQPPAPMPETGPMPEAAPAGVPLFTCVKVEACAGVSSLHASVAALATEGIAVAHSETRPAHKAPRRNVLMFPRSLVWYE